MNENHIEIQKVEKEDYEELRRIFLKIRQESFNWLETDTIKLEDFDYDTKGELILTGKINKKIVGFASVWEADKFIHNLFVLSDFKRCGAGKALINKCADLVGLPLTLKCVKQNENALRFYLSQGWLIEEEASSKETYYLMKYYG